jgi:hypothetical protein
VHDLPHRRADHRHLALAALAQALRPALEEGAAPQCRDGREVQSLQKSADRLYADLQNKGVRCWLASEDLKIGEKIRHGIDEAIKMHDKLLLVLSRHSVASDWVEQEVETALALERKEKRTVLFPIRLDDSVIKVETG